MLLASGGSFLRGLLTDRNIAGVSESREWTGSDASIYREYRNIDSISIYRIVSPAEISKFSIYRYQLFDLSSCRIFTCGVKKS